MPSIKEIETDDVVEAEENLTVFVIDGNCVSRLMTFLVIWDHHRDIQGVQSLWRKSYADITTRTMCQ